MALRPPSRYSASETTGRVASGGQNPLDHEIAGEKAAALGRAGDRVRASLARLQERGTDALEREIRLSEASAAVYAYFIQRELCGMRRHQDAIHEYRIPAEVLARLGAS